MTINPILQVNRLSVALVLTDKVFSSEVQVKLEKLGFLAWSVPNAKELYKRLLSDKADILVVDIADAENFEAIKHLGSLNKYLISTIGSDAESNLETEALACGADRFLRGPLSYEKLILNINAMLKYLPHSSDVLETNLDAPWQLNSKRMVLLAPNAVSVKLTVCEFILLKMLLQSQGKPVACDVLLSSIFPNSDIFKRRDIHMLIYRLRRKT